MKALMSIAKKSLVILFKLIVWFIKFPYKVFKFMLDHAILLAIYTVLKSTAKVSFKVLRRPFFLGLAMGASGLFVLGDKKRREKVLGLLTGK